MAREHVKRKDLFYAGNQTIQLSNAAKQKRPEQQQQQRCLFLSWLLPDKN